MTKAAGTKDAGTEIAGNLDNVYGAENAEATRQAYDGWTEGYDAENIGNGYRVPGIGCAMIARYVDLQAGQFTTQPVVLASSAGCSSSWATMQSSAQIYHR